MTTHEPQDAVAPDYTRYHKPTSPTTASDEKRTFLRSAELPTHSLSTQRHQPRSRMMISIRALLVVLTCLLVTFSLTLALTDDPRSPCHDGRDRSSGQSLPGDASSNDPSTLRGLLDSVSPESLHELLHQYFPGRYQHGIWPSDRAAVEAVAVHPEDGPAVTSLVRLMRRDNTTSTTPSSTPGPAPSSTPTPVPTTPIPTTSGGPPPSSSSTGGAPSSSSSGPGSTSDSSPKPAPTSRRPQTNTFTSTINGVPTVVTQTTYVDGPEGGAQASTVAASLQTNAAVAPGRGQGLVDAAIAGAVVVGGVLLV